jgi:DNA modification methylase
MIKEENGFKHNFSNATGRWAGVGPYYAMFPLTFAFNVVDKYTSRGESVLDPFAGRGSSVYAAAVRGRSGLGIEINPVGWIYSQAKLHTSSQPWVIRRLNRVKEAAHHYEDEVADLPDFFHHCYCPQVLKFLLAARSILKWRRNKSDATLMALILIYLHGKRDRSLSNQMRQAKAMSPDYSVQWWKDRDMKPPRIDPYDFMRKRIVWRYKNGCPPAEKSEVRLGNSVDVMKGVQEEVKNKKQKPFSLLFTSPPYYGVTNYYYDQWLRLWMLGGPPYPKSPGEKYKRKFQSREVYKDLLQRVFSQAAQTLSEDAVVYVRTDAREYTFNTTREVLQSCFPEKDEEIKERPVSGETQTALYGNKSHKPGEIDIVMM